jgi:hypothetical protein
MQPLFGNLRVYYEQWVEPGDFVLTRILAVTRNAFVATSAGVR